VRFQRGSCCASQSCESCACSGRTSGWMSTLCRKPCLSSPTWKLESCKPSGLECLFPGIGVCRELRRLDHHEWNSHTPAQSLTQLRRLTHFYIFSSLGFSSPPGMRAVTSLRVLDMGCIDLGVLHGTTELLVPSLRRLTFDAGRFWNLRIPASLQELNLSESLHDSLWAVGRLRILRLNSMHSRVAIPSEISQLSLLEKLHIDSWDSLQPARIPHGAAPPEPAQL